MVTTRIEPGLLRIFRWFVGLRLGLLVLQLLSLRSRPADETVIVPRPGVVVYALLFAWLMSDRIRNKVGEAYLPIALGVAAVSPIFENAITVGIRLDEGETLTAAVADYWLLFFVLFVPLMLVAWQYRYRYVVLYAVGTSLLDVVLLAPQLAAEGVELGGQGYQATMLSTLTIGRGILFLFVGYFVTKIVATQRAQRQSLERHAATREQLATTRERARLARELHDTLAHSLSAVAVQLEGVRSLWDDDPVRARTLLDRSLEGARDGMTEARRAIKALRASPLEELGLASAIAQLGAAISETSTLAVAVHASTEFDGLDPLLEQTVYRVADEALTNVVRHAEATMCDVSLVESGQSIVLTISDDGQGFDASVDPGSEHNGMRGMHERAELIDGVLTVETKPGSGTTIRLEAPTPS